MPTRSNISPTIIRWIIFVALGVAYEAEQGPAAKDAIAQILTNSRMCAEGHRRFARDTGIVTVFVKWGKAACSIQNDRCRRSSMKRTPRYLHPENKLRASILADPALPASIRETTRLVCSTSNCCPATMSMYRSLRKGGGSENKSKFKMLNPSDSIVDWVLEMIPADGRGAGAHRGCSASASAGQLKRQ